MIAFVALFALLSAQDKPVAPEALGRMPVREITVFKDGHAFVLHEAAMPVDAAGNVVLDGLPAPVIGTFWPYAADPAAKLGSVVAGRKAVRVDQPALSVHELLEANPGAEVFIKETAGERYPAKVVGIPERENPAGEPRRIRGNVLLLETAEGHRAVPLERIQDVVFKQKGRLSVPREESRSVLTLRLDWEGKPAAKDARVGMMYLQKGLRWIPSYRIELDGKGRAKLKLQATLLNELADLDDVTAHFVIGVPSFAFKDTVDPIALQKGIEQAAGRLSAYFQEPNQTAYAFGNAMMTQVARMSEHRPAPAGPADPAGLPGEQSEDLFVFTVKGIRLKKGECAVFPVAESTLPYKDVFALDLPITPPQELRQHSSNPQQLELARLFNAPKAVHKVRLTNDGKAPLTTAPALLVRDGRVLGQGMMTYTPPGGRCDVEVTKAVDLQVKKSDVEEDRQRRAFQWRGSDYDRIVMRGRVTITNLRGVPVELEVTRHVLGEADRVGQEGKAERVNALEDGGFVQAHSLPYWWSWYSWPWYWHHINPVTRVAWTVKLEPGKSVELDYSWHYFWQ